jgi:hypothetical protein
MIWREVRPALAEASGRSATVLNHYTQLYLHTQVSGIRRLGDQTQRTVSLVRLLRDIARKPHHLNRGRWIQLVREHDPSVTADELQRAAEEFSVWTDPGSDYVSATRVRADADHFIRTARNANQFANKVIAHRHDGEIKLPLTWGEIDAAIDEAGLLLRRYTALIKSAHLALLEPVLSGDWLGPLRSPLFDRDRSSPVRGEILPPVRGWEA